MHNLVDDGAEIGDESANSMAISGPYEVDFLGVASLYHFAFKEMVVIKLAIWRVVSIEVLVRSVFGQPCLFCVFQTTHMVVIFENVVERSILVDKDVDSLVTHKLHSLP